jgi:DEAD/DEAH box helicase domain-containing protein
LANRRDQVKVTARLGDSETERLAAQTYRPRWRKFLASLNLFQFCGAFTFFTTSQVEAGTAPDVIPYTQPPSTSNEWAEVRAEVIPSLQYIVGELAAAGVTVPQVAYEDEQIAEAAIAEMAWLELRVAVLAGDQAWLAPKWQTAGWQVVTVSELQGKGTNFLSEIVVTKTKEKS